MRVAGGAECGARGGVPRRAGMRSGERRGRRPASAARPQPGHTQYTPPLPRPRRRTLPSL